MTHLSDQECEASAAAAKVAVNLLSSARVILKLDNAFTHYSSQYLLDNVCPKNDPGQGETDRDSSKLTAKDCLEFVFREGIPKAQDWPHLGSLFKPPSSYVPARVTMEGQVIEPKTLTEAYKFFTQQPIGARLHVFTPELDDHVGEEGTYAGPSSHRTSYVGLRDVMVVAVKKVDGEQPFATVKIHYNKQDTFVKVALDAMFLRVSSNGDESEVINPGPLLVDYFLPRLSIN